MTTINLVILLDFLVVVAEETRMPVVEASTMTNQIEELSLDSLGLALELAAVETKILNLVTLEEAVLITV